MNSIKYYINQSPLSFYKKIYRSFNNPRNEIFFGMPISSAGFKHILFKQDNDLLPEEISLYKFLNKSLGKLIIDKYIALQNTQKKKSALHVSTPKKWEEFDYNRFWLYYIAGINPSYINEFDMHMCSKINHQLFNNHCIDKKIRKNEYSKLFIHYSTHINTKPKKPVNAIYFLPDYHKSLGCMLEYDLAKFLGIKTYAINYQFHVEHV